MKAIAHLRHLGRPTKSQKRVLCAHHKNYELSHAGSPEKCYALKIKSTPLAHHRMINVEIHRLLYRYIILSIFNLLDLIRALKLAIFSRTDRFQKLCRVSTFLFLSEEYEYNIIGSILDSHLSFLISTLAYFATSQRNI